MAITPEQEIDSKKTISWGRQYQRAAEAVFEQMLHDGIPATRADDSMNMSAVVLYALQQQARFPRRKAKPK